AGVYDISSGRVGGDTTLIDGTDHVRLHPRCLHSHATDHKWVLGALAELLDNSLDEAALQILPLLMRASPPKYYFGGANLNR
ncbi:hypothetical protein MKW98_013871, partial [Papaver atlanticum]